MDAAPALDDSNPQQNLLKSLPQLHQQLNTYLDQMLDVLDIPLPVAFEDPVQLEKDMVIVHRFLFLKTAINDMKKSVEHFGASIQAANPNTP
jgi:hypothetical protein